MFAEKRQENGPVAERNMTRQKKQEDYRQKRESNDNPEIPDRGMNIKHPRPPFGVSVNNI